jgi:hypothetical protein
MQLEEDAMKRIGLLFCLMSAAIPCAAQATAFKVGEVQNANTKDCYYTYAGNTYLYTVASYGICPLSVTVSTAPAPPPVSGTAFKAGEVQRGAVKDCYYQYLGRMYIQTVASYELCPLSVAVP